MRILEERSALLSNHEVLKLLHERRDERLSLTSSTSALKRPGKDNEEMSSFRHLPHNVATIEFELTKYLENTACWQAKYTDDHVRAFLEAMRRWPLTKGEKLGILNHRPQSIAELAMLVDEFAERFPQEEQHEQLMALLDSTLPPRPVHDDDQDTDMQRRPPSEE